MEFGGDDGIGNEYMDEEGERRIYWIDKIEGSSGGERVYTKAGEFTEEIFYRPQGPVGRDAESAEV